MAAFLNKKEVIICVTDDGLGGLSVLSEIERELQAAAIFPKVGLLYYNSAVKPACALRPIADQISIFNSALHGMTAYAPDIILIACSSLSVIYAKTAYSKTATIPVMSIVDFGVDLLAEAVSSDPTSVALIFGTVITAKIAAHREALVKRGIAPERIVMQDCPELAFTIQSSGADSPETEARLSQSVHEAWTEMVGRGLESATTVYAGLCCSHYGYSLPLWNKALAAESISSEGRISKAVKTACINPNSSMAMYIFKQSTRPLYASCEISIQVLSKVGLTTEIDHIAPFLSPRVGEAVRAYVHKVDLFDNELIPRPLGAEGMGL